MNRVTASAATIKTRLKSRLLRASAALAALAVGWWILVAAGVGELPGNFRYSATTVSYDDWFDEASGTFAGPVKSSGELVFERVSSGGSGAGQGVPVRAVFRLLSADTKQPSLVIERRYAIDPETWGHVSSVEADRNRDGHLFAPPGIRAGESFTYWHPNYDAPARMDFAGTENVLGLETYRYVAAFPDGKVDQTAALGHVSGVGKTRGVVLEPHLEIWIEPQTGWLIKYEDHALASFYDLETGEVQSPWNRFRNRYTATAVEGHVEAARLEALRRAALCWGIPLALLLAALLLAALHVVSRRPDRRALVARWLPRGVVAVILGGTVFSWIALQGSLDRRSQIHLAADAARISDALANRMSVYSNTLLSARGLLYSSEEVTREEWHAFTESLNIRRSYPGLQAINCLQIVSGSRLGAFEASVRAGGVPDYSVSPAKPAREIYAPIVFTAPADERNLRGLGYDGLSDPVRREFLERARDTDAVALSAKIQLVTENGRDVQPGFAACLPTYEAGDTSTVEGRRDALAGYVCAIFRGRNFGEDVISAGDYELRFEIFDGDNATSETSKIFDSEDGAPLASGVSITQTVDVFGRPWTLRFSGPSGYGLSLFERVAPSGLLGFGLFSGFLVYGALTALSGFRPRREEDFLDAPALLAPGD